MPRPAPGDPDPVPLKLIAHARAAQQSALTGEPDPIVFAYSKRHLWQLLRVSWFAPDIVAAIPEGATCDFDRQAPIARR